MSKLLAIPSEYMSSTQQCPILCTWLGKNQHRNQLANIQPPLIRLTIDSMNTVCQETRTRDIRLRMQCLRPDMRCFCLSLVQFMYFSRDSITARPRDANGQQHHATLRHETFNWVALIYLMPMLLAIALLLGGLIKALIGCYSPDVAQWKYDYMQPQYPFPKAGW